MKLFCVDRILAIVLIVILSPILVLLLCVTFLDLKCNPIFVQIRTLSGEKNFRFYKIRSMNKLAPNVPTGEFTNANLHITRWGRFLRMYSLDELLNLICIINGDMEFIGPRPIMPVETELLALRSKNAINSKPGITGLAQIKGRDLITLNRKVACERYYDHRKSSIKLRIYIIYVTFLIVIKKTGISH
jgi:O-antigen biosynthesis protein WbqP